MPRAKANGYDYGIHVPLFIRWAETPRKGSVVDQPVGFVDISATILDAVGVRLSWIEGGEPNRKRSRSGVGYTTDRKLHN
jgi:arylsulfatase A-like enzyme